MDQDLIPPKQFLIFTIVKLIHWWRFASFGLGCNGFKNVHYVPGFRSVCIMYPDMPNKLPFISIRFCALGSCTNSTRPDGNEGEHGWHAPLNSVSPPLTYLTD